jgi:hypothetical protein
MGKHREAGSQRGMTGLQLLQHGIFQQVFAAVDHVLDEACVNVRAG